MASVPANDTNVAALPVKADQSTKAYRNATPPIALDPNLKGVEVFADKARTIIRDRMHAETRRLIDAAVTVVMAGGTAVTPMLLKMPALARVTHDLSPDAIVGTGVVATAVILTRTLWHNEMVKWADDDLREEAQKCFRWFGAAYEIPTRKLRAKMEIGSSSFTRGLRVISNDLFNTPVRSARCPAAIAAAKARGEPHL